ncbi:unnamed protein product [Notodromas monacha]|uniref:Zinc finger protein 704 n=1 Tax=Notodromas monacha TaxID=399045 RepID=A0A7R9BM61_9CRUS|nr:unnamed protein product [Notodromas monacha]CAG0917211.1 unnamed protein product [Notodromas monacha]
MLALASWSSGNLDSEGTRTAYKCTWKGCDFLTLTCSVVENHVKDTHLGDEIDDLAFYYTEIDVPEENFFDVLHALEDGVGAKQKFVVGSVQERHLAETRDVLRGSGDSYVGFHASSAPTLSHMDMARPPHENPDLMSHSPSQRTTAVPISIPQRGISWHPYGGSPLSPHKYARHSPKPGTSPKMVLVSRSRRAESKKCRKVYGVDNRDLWCTQCKWKKACTRFQE